MPINIELHEGAFLVIFSFIQEENDASILTHEIDINIYLLHKVF